VLIVLLVVVFAGFRIALRCISPVYVRNMSQKKAWVVTHAFAVCTHAERKRTSSL
jgi:hypothetical protein